MRIDQRELFALAKTTGFRAEMLEKVIILTDLLTAFHQHPMLHNKLAGSIFRDCFLINQNF